MTVLKSARLSCAFVGLLLFLAPLVLYAQLPTGNILGTITDPTGSVVAEAKITATDIDTGALRTYSTGTDGFYRFPALPVGNYQLQVEAKGFSTIVEKGIVLTVGQEATVNVTLKVGAASEKIEVTSETAPQVDTTTSSLGTLVSENTIADLPLNGRNYVDLSLLQPGVTQQTQETKTQGIVGTIFSSNGASVRSNNIMLDGTPMINGAGMNSSSAGGTTLGLDGVKEYKIITNMFSAEYGLVSGSQTTISSKSGSNRMHGDVFEYLRNNSLDARNYFDPTSAQLNGKRIPEFRRNQFGATIGGPIKKDKSFYFVNYEGLRQIRGNPLYQGVSNTFPVTCWDSTTKTILATNNPCAAAPFNADYPNPVAPTPGYPPFETWSNPTLTPPGPTQSYFTGSVASAVLPLANLFGYPNVFDEATGVYDQTIYSGIENTREDFGQARFDYTFSPNDSFFTRYTIDDTLQYDPDSSPNFQDVLASRSQFLTFSENHTFNDHLLNTAMFSFARTALGTSTNSPTSNIASDQLISGWYTGLMVVAPLTTVGGNAAPGYLNQNLLTLGDDLFYTKGKNSIKAGFLINHFENHAVNNVIPGSVLPSASIPFFAPANLAGENFFGSLFLAGFSVGPSFKMHLDPTTGLPTSEEPPDVERDYLFWTVGAYAQDDYRLTNRLTLNLGLRYEPSTVPSEKNGKNYGYQNVLTGTLATVTVAGPIWKNPTLKNFSPRAGFAWDTFGNGKTSVKGGYGIYYDVANIGTLFTVQGFSAPPLSTIVNYMPSTPFPFVPITVPLTGASGITSSTDFSPYVPEFLGNVYNPKRSYLEEYNLTMQQQLAGRFAISVAYAGSRGIHLHNLQELNPVQPCNMPGSTTASNPGCTDYGDGINRTAQPWNNGMNPVWDPTLNNQTCPLYPLATANSCRLNPHVAMEALDATNSDSWYNSLQVLFAKQMSHGLQLQTAFTWSKLEDTTSGMRPSAAEGSDMPSDPFNVKFDKGPTAFDAKANLRVSATYDFPNLHSNGFASLLANGWQMSNIVVYQTGFPFSCQINGTPHAESNDELNGEDAGGDISNDRCDIVTSSNLAWAQEIDPSAQLFDKNKVIQHKVQWFNPHMFTLAQPGFLGRSGRDAYRGPGEAYWDMSMVKNTKAHWMGESGNVEFRAEFFNLTNHSNFQFPTTSNWNANYVVFQTSGNGPAIQTPTGITNAPSMFPTAGQITNTLINARQVQFALKLAF